MAASKKNAKKLNPKLVKVLRRVQNSYYPKLEKSITKLLKTYAEEYRKALDAFEIKELSKSEMNRLYKRLGEINKRLARYEVVGKVPLGDPLMQSAVETGKALGLDFDMANPEVIKFIRNYQFKFAKKIGDTSVKKVKTIIKKGEKEGWMVNLVREALEQEFYGWNTIRAEIVARTEIIRSTNRGARFSYEEVGGSSVWITTEDERLCLFCNSMDNKVVKKNESYFKEGDIQTIAAEDGSIFKLNHGYEDVDSPPLHPRCRCSLGIKF